VTKYKDNFQAVEGADGMSWRQASVLRQGASRPYPMRMCGMEHPSTRPDARLVIAAIAKADIPGQQKILPVRNISDGTQAWRLASLSERAQCGV